MADDDRKALESLGLEGDQLDGVLALLGGLRKNRDDLLEEKKRLKDQIDSAGSSEEVKALKERLKRMEKAEERAKLEAKEDYEGALKSVREEYEAALREKEEALTQVSSKYSTLVTDQALTTALSEVGVKKELMPGAKALFRSQVELKDDQPLIEGKPVAEALKAWASDEEAKAWLAAPLNSGAGARGSRNGEPAPQNLKRSEMDPKAKSDFISEHGREAYEQLPI